MNMKTMDSDDAFYFFHQGGRLQGFVITHGDDFTIARTRICVDRVLSLVELELTVSKIERDHFHYTG